MFKKPYLEYKKEATDRGVVCVTVYANRKTFFEIECFEDSPYTIEEEIQNWLSDNGYDDEALEVLEQAKRNYEPPTYAIDRPTFMDTDAVWEDTDGHKWLIDYEDISNPNSAYFFTLYDEEDDDVMDERSDYYTYEQLLKTDSFKPLGYYRKSETN